MSFKILTTSENIEQPPIATGDDDIVAVSLFTDLAVAQTSTATLLPWIKENLGPLMASGTDPADGEVLVAAMA